MNTRRYDPEAARADILDAAERLFAAKGFDGVSTAKIAKEAGVSQSQIHYHFETKEKLWKAIFERRFADYFAAQSTLLHTEGMDDIARMEASIRSYFGFFEANPHYIRLLGRAQLEAPKGPTGQELGAADEMGADLMRKGSEVIAKAQRIGTIRNDVRPEFVIVGFLSMVAYWFQGGHLFMSEAGVEGCEALDPQYLDFILKVYLRGIAP